MIKNVENEKWIKSWRREREKRIFGLNTNCATDIWIASLREEKWGDGEYN